jgi:hypothetical protein
MRRLVVVGWLCGAVFLAPRMGFGAAESPAAISAISATSATSAASAAVDLSDLNLRVVEGRAVDSLQVNATAIKPGKGEKLVLVSLRGRLPAPGRLTVAATAFSALYSESVTKPGEPNAERVGKAQAQAVDLGQDEAWAASTTASYPKVKDIRIDIALSLPAGVNDFFLLYDTAKGKQRVAVKMGAKGTSPTP